MIALVLSTLAHADDLTWTCPPLAVPADGAVFRDPERTGVRDFSDAVEAVTRGYFDEACPSDEFDVTSACYTSAGHAISVASTDRGGEVVVVPASGDLQRLTVSWDFGVPYSLYGSTLRDNLTLWVSWGGTADGAWRPDATVEAAILSHLGYSWSGEFSAASWDDGTCAWSVTVTTDDASDDVTSWHIEADGHTLEVTEGPVDACMPLGARATFDGASVEVYPETWIAPGGDADGDGFTIELGDCDDTDPSSYPCAVPEICDAVDHDCDGIVAGDADGDGYLSCEDCADLDPEVHPGVADLDCDGVDQDCNGQDGPDADEDGYSVCDDCDDEAREVNPGRTDRSCDGIDQDCDGHDGSDNDGDGYTECEECDDERRTVRPDRTDTDCDGVDWNCDGLDAEDQDGDGWDRCEDCDDADAASHPGALERPGDGIDQNCDGVDAMIEPVTPTGTGAGCSTVAPTGVLSLVAVALIRRRRPR